MKRMILVALCAIPLAGGAYAKTSGATDGVVTWTVPGDDGALARRGRGADDPAGDDHGRHGAGHAANELTAPLMQTARRGRGADDPAGDDHGHHGAGHA